MSGKRNEDRKASLTDSLEEITDDDLAPDNGEYQAGITQAINRSIDEIRIFREAFSNSAWENHTGKEAQGSKERAANDAEF